MAIPRKIEAFFTKEGARYRHRVHAPAFTAEQLARAEHVPERIVAKTVVFLGDGVFALAVLPADEKGKREKET